MDPVTDDISLRLLEMEYNRMYQATFLRRPNRFIAYCLKNGEEVICHVKNTGRCRELLLPGASVWLEENHNPNRKTHFSLIAVQKGDRLINMDSQAPNAASYEAFQRGFQPSFITGNIQDIRREVAFGISRFDLCLTVEDKPFFIEVKGVTLEEDGIVRFPDAPTERGTKHLRELTRMRMEGIQTGVLFVVQMEGVRFFAPNGKTDPMFAEALIKAEEAKVGIAAWDCLVTPQKLQLRQEVPVYLNR